MIRADRAAIAAEEDKLREKEDKLADLKAKFEREKYNMTEQQRFILVFCRGVELIA